ncbi:hypothetical protein [Actinomadura latina]|uniref:hypothetical protein n=1 Tax=Actinomadura latina TaxID=163603 RepID=UPI000B3221AD|nr:hypothetical protein [Actinomadura latina]
MIRFPEDYSGRTSSAAPTARPHTSIEMDADIDQALDHLRRAFPGLCIWHCEYSGSLWALLPDRLVEAKTSTDLARRLHAALAPQRPPAFREPAVHPADGVRHATVTPGPPPRSHDETACPRPNAVSRPRPTARTENVPHGSRPSPRRLDGSWSLSDRGWRSAAPSRVRGIVHWLLTTCIHLTAAVPR